MPLVKRLRALLLIGTLFSGLLCFGISQAAFAQTAPAGALESAYNVAHDAPVQITSYEPAASFHAVENKLYPGPSAGVTANSETWTGFFASRRATPRCYTAGNRDADRVFDAVPGKHR
ncbi:MAG: hypothetical protein OWT27_03850 [Firmicutes bacterium]|nr:hypothetical protein [Bacillota bacterium]